MNPQTLVATVATIRTAVWAGKRAWQSLDQLLARVERNIDRSDPVSLPLTQAEVDNIVAVYTPLYNAALTAIEQAGDTLGTDAFN